ncbi:DUF4389 domain-containing protein [Limibaculum sp. M0105]|uniref:DUF4389 domain-containing protein n=1 Tax=Thermohalobaculum xanthum TaxID=2753746 RepID=A0A8J7M499_9RHOB|nr:DUF4389 domain-containing protein [Thermohalobaculum xanthum]MBK0397954.1 DUF4389 domain-containing protein [Thermohalobaculum xanthum]
MTRKTYDDDYDDAPASEPRRDRKPVWIRGAFMLFFLAAFSLAQGLLAATAVIQFLSLLIAGSPNAFLVDFGKSLGRWLDQTAKFQSAASEERPFPWAPWPRAD